MINLIDSMIEEILRDELPESEYDISFDVPTKEWSVRISGNKPVINVYLYDIYENLTLRSNEWSIEKYRNRSYRKEHPDVKLDLYYIITVWSPANYDGVIEEHSIIGMILSKLFEFTIVPEKYLRGELRSAKSEVSISVATREAFREQGIGQLWNTMEQPWKPAIYLTVTAPISIQKRITGKTVFSRKLRIGQIEDIFSVTVHPEVRSEIFHKSGTEIYLANLTDKLSYLDRWRNRRYRTLIVKDSSSFKTGDRIVILDGEKTEFNRIISVTGNKLVLKNRLLYTHSKNIEVRVLEHTDKLKVELQKDVLAGQKKILLTGEDVYRINLGDILVLKENEKEEILLAVSTGLERGTVEMEDFISFGGIVTNSSEKPSPVIGAKVISMDENDRVLDFTFTDINGRFLFEKISGKTKKLKIQRQGYKEKTVDIERFDIENLSIKLQPID